MLISEPAVTYAEVRHLMMDTLRGSHPEWKAEVLDAYERRIVTMFQLLKLRQEHGGLDR